MTSPVGTTSYSYDTAGRLVSLTNPSNETTAWTFDHAGRVTGETTTGPGVTTLATVYGWGGSGQGGDPSTAPAYLRTLTQTVGGQPFQTYTLTHSFLSQLQQVTGTGVFTETGSYGYDGRGRLTGDAEQVVTGGQVYQASDSYTYDLSGIILLARLFHQPGLFHLIPLLRYCAPASCRRPSLMLGDRFAMRIVHLAAGAGGMYCGACARDAALVRGLIGLGHDMQVVPLYTPLRLDSGDPLPETPIYLGGINAYLQQVSPLFRRTPRVLDRLLDHPGLLRWASQFAVQTRPEDLGPMTVSVLAGRDGRQRKELDRLLDLLAGGPRPDVVSITNSLLSGIAPEIKRRLGAPVVCGLQGEDSFVLAIPEPHRAEALRWMRKNAGAIDRFIAPGDACAETMTELLALPPAKVRIIRAGMDAAPYRHDAPRPRQPFVVGCLSSITPVKGQDLLVEAVRLLTEQGREVRLRLAGRILNPAYGKQVFRRIATAGLSDRAAYEGEVDFAGKRAFLRGCSAFALPSRLPEARGVAVMEALASGLPVIVPERGVFPEMLARTGGGLLFPPEDAAGLAAALARLMDDPDAADRMGLAGAAGIARDYSAARMAREVQDACAELAGGMTPTA